MPGLTNPNSYTNPPDAIDALIDFVMLRIRKLRKITQAAMRLMQSFTNGPWLFMMYLSGSRKFDVHFRDKTRILVSRSVFGGLLHLAYFEGRLPCTARGNRLILDNGSAVGGFSRDIHADVLTSNGWEVNNKSISKGGIVFCRESSLGAINEVFVNQVYQADVSGGIVVDIGAGFGDSSLYFAMNGAQMVLAYEPNPSVYWSVA